MPEFAGNFKTINLAEVLRMLTMTKQTGILRMTMGLEQGFMGLDQGLILNALTGNVSGPQALYQFILWRDADFAFKEQPIEATAPRELASYDPAILIDGVAKKIDELAALQQAVPTLDSILYFLGSESLGTTSATPSELGLLLLADGKNTIEQIATKTQMNGLEVARIMARFRLAGVVELVTQVVPANTPLPEPVHEDPIIPGVPEPIAPEPPPLPSPSHSGEGEGVRYWRGKRIE